MSRDVQSRDLQLCHARGGYVTWSRDRHVTLLQTPTRAALDGACTCVPPPQSLYTHKFQEGDKAHQSCVVSTAIQVSKATGE
eukprot:2595631-Rhodomonas_salina.1